MRKGKETSKKESQESFFSPLFWLLVVNLVTAKFFALIFSSQNDDEKISSFVFFVLFESFSRFSFEECESAFSSYLQYHTVVQNTYCARIL